MPENSTDAAVDQLERLIDEALAAAQRGDDAAVLQALADAETVATTLPRKEAPPDVIYLPGPQA